MNFREVSERIKAEASLSYRLLRYLNSPAFPLVTKVHSIPHALSLLGELGVRKWISLVAVACMGDEKPAELVALPMIRARFCELRAPHAGLEDSANDLFLLGLLSAMERSWICAWNKSSRRFPFMKTFGRPYWEEKTS